MNKAVDELLTFFNTEDGELLMNGEKVSTILKGKTTPAYIYDSRVLKLRHDILRKNLPEELSIYYAVKANPNASILKKLSDLYDGFDIASIGEMKRALEAGIPAEKMSFAGPGKSIEELKFAIQKGIGSISVENERELEHIIEISSATAKESRILLRVNPEFDLTKSGMKMGGGAKQFGIDSEKIPQVIANIKKHNFVKLIGIHIYAGSQILNAESIVETFGKIIGYAKELMEISNFSFQKINLGGGFGVPYFANDRVLDIRRVGSGLQDILARNRKHFPNTRFNIELGRYIVGECGLYLAKILYRKRSRGQVFLILDGGMHHHLAASGNFGQSLVRRPFPIIIANKIGSPKEKVNVVGPLCTPLDTFGSGLELEQADEGDYLAVLNSGAYGFSASPRDFLSHKEPIEIVV